MALDCALTRPVPIKNGPEQEETRRKKIRHANATNEPNFPLGPFFLLAATRRASCAPCTFFSSNGGRFEPSTRRQADVGLRGNRGLSATPDESLGQYGGMIEKRVINR